MYIYIYIIYIYIYIYYIYYPSHDLSTPLGEHERKRSSGRRWQTNGLKAMGHWRTAVNSGRLRNPITLILNIIKQPINGPKKMWTFPTKPWFRLGGSLIWTGETKVVHDARKSEGWSAKRLSLVDGRWDPCFFSFVFSMWGCLKMDENPQLTIGIHRFQDKTYGYLWIPGYVKIAIENCPFIVDLPIEDGDFP